MDSYEAGDAAIRVHEVERPAQVVLSWRGRSDEREPRRTLGPFLRGVVDRAAARRAAVEVQCQQITYINSATIGCVVEMIQHCATAAVPVTLRYDRATGWQRLSFEALRVMVRGAGQLVVEGV